MTVIGRNPARRKPAPRRSGGGASDCLSTLFRSSDVQLGRATCVGRARQADIKRRKWRPMRRSGEKNAALRLSVRGVVIGAGAVSRNPLPGSGGGGPRNRAAAFRFPAAWASCAHLPTIPCLRRRASAGDTLQESGGSAAARGQLDFAMAAIGNPYPAPQAATGLPTPPDRVLPSPLLLVSEPASAWIMPGLPEHSCAAGMPRAPECMAPPRIARPQTWGKIGKNSWRFRRMARRRKPSASSARGTAPAAPGVASSRWT